MRIDHLETLPDGSLGGFTSEGELVGRGICVLELVAQQHAHEGADPAACRQLWLDARSGKRKLSRRAFVQFGRRKRFQSPDTQK